ncbi:hypothetical protein GHT06_004463 [Daphnia sinensis]|uniref:Uncharacterized protein n=1 Tax=Daphnia sinensis TaxID=1820382 RepID=A0AAD5KTD8_9CRUS|nr:hypothetical protein GHT06_004463 [Daphnia sinensis]
MHSYMDILTNQLVPFARKMFPLPDNEDPDLRELPENHQQYRFFMHDGCPAHNAIIIRDWFAGEASHHHRIKKIWWPAFSDHNSMGY